MHYYFAFGLSIESALLLPELEESARPVTPAAIRIDRALGPRTRLGGFGERFEASEDGVRCTYRAATYVVRGGRQIFIQAAHGTDERLVRLPLFTTVLATLLHQRGRLVLHGSAVSIDGRAAAILGHSGWGKSTIAAALYGRGHRVLSDDVASVELDPATPTRGRAVVYPGLPMLKLKPDAAAAALGDDPASLPLVAPQSAKRARRVQAGFSADPAVLSAIYILANGSDVAIEPLSRSEAVRRLIAHSFVALLGSPALEGSDGMRHLKQCAYLARAIPVYRLARPRSLGLLGVIATSVSDHMRDLAPEKLLAPEMALS